MPDTFPYKNPEETDVLKAYRLKNQWGGRLLNRFMVGTFYNLNLRIVWRTRQLGPSCARHLNQPQPYMQALLARSFFP
jgi:hypothetical protein